MPCVNCTRTWKCFRNEVPLELAPQDKCEAGWWHFPSWWCVPLTHLRSYFSYFEPQLQEKWHERQSFPKEEKVLIVLLLVDSQQKANVCVPCDQSTRPLLMGRILSTSMIKQAMRMGRGQGRFFVPSVHIQRLVGAKGTCWMLGCFRWGSFCF